MVNGQGGWFDFLKKILKFFFQKIKSATMPDHHVKGQPAASTYVRKKGCITFDTNRETPCIFGVIIMDFWKIFEEFWRRK